ncbi:bleomycin hydrolase [Nowakowskiella sp. JEL0078]|nr:bleomycin hydrolase [Nowakowskiella sp. JEL0078]
MALFLLPKPLSGLFSLAIPSLTRPGFSRHGFSSVSNSLLVAADAVVIGLHKNSDLPNLSVLNSKVKDNFLLNLSNSKFSAELGELRLCYDNSKEAPAPIIVAVGLGKKSSEESTTAENARIAAAESVSAIKTLLKKSKEGDQTPIKIAMSSLGSALGTAEGAILSSYSFDDYKKIKSRTPKVTIHPIDLDQTNVSLWEAGIFQATAQNYARTLMETPSNLMTPTHFCDRAGEMFSNFSSVDLSVHDEAWARQQDMGAFLSVARGSAEPLKFLEIRYMGASKDHTPLAIVGKGVTFDSGGISIKPSGDMALMKGDMGGAAVTLSALWALAALKVNINCIAVIPLTENMPSGTATKPGDLVYARNGKSIEVECWSNHLKKRIHYAAKAYKPHTLIELSTLTGAMDVALGTAFAGVFTKSDRLWKSLQKAGLLSGDRVWRMPLDSAYRKQISSNVADLKNVGVRCGRGGGSCTAAIFLDEFVPTPKELKEGTTAVDESEENEAEETSKSEDGTLKDWNAEKNGIMFAHIDIAGVMHHRTAIGYVASGMTAFYNKGDQYVL